MPVEKADPHIHFIDQEGFLYALSGWTWLGVLCLAIAIHLDVHHAEFVITATKKAESLFSILPSGWADQTGIYYSSGYSFKVCSKVSY